VWTPPWSSRAAMPQAVRCSWLVCTVNR
jgi:hypothetical protein